MAVVFVSTSDASYGDADGLVFVPEELAPLDEWLDGASDYQITTDARDIHQTGEGVRLEDIVKALNAALNDEDDWRDEAHAILSVLVPE